MSKVNVFGKPIEFDIGVTQADENSTPIPKDTVGVQDGDDLSVFTKSQAVEFAKETIQPNDNKDVSTFSTTFSNDNSFSNPQYYEADSANPVQSPVNKGTGKENDGNRLLSNVTSPDDIVIVPKFTSPILKRNRFTSDKKQDPTANFRVNPDHPENTLGSYQEFLKSTNGKDFTDGHFAHIGAALSLRSTRELLAATRTGYGPDGPDGVGASAASILPGLTQAGLLKVNTNDLNVSDVLNQIIAADTTVANLDPNSLLANHTTLQINDSSWGQMTNVLEPFTGLLPLGMLGLSVALVLALKLALRGILITFTTITSAGKSSTSHYDKNGRMVPGKNLIHENDDSSSFLPIPLPASLFGLRETTHNFSDCVDLGMEKFFGGKITDVGSTLTRILESPGFYAVFCRSIVRSASQVVDAVKGAIKGNPIQIAENIIALVEIIKSSKIVSAMNMFATIGDAQLNLEELTAYKALDDKQQAAVRLSVIDSLSDDSATGYKSRLNGKLQLAWSTRNSPSAFLIPQNFVASLSAMAQTGLQNYSDAFPVMVNQSLELNKSVINADRLDTTTVQAIEAKLDAEYMPFYFHDLRTNEIIGFPAFLSGLTDDFQVNWESGDYYGRIDQVKIYKSTHRKVSLSFIIAATSEDDFDQMWFKINKLITMVYPQWSEGTVLNNKDANVKFTQPFSQVPTASPLVRIRLGDLLRSNYSRFALARLFGLGSKNFAIDAIGELSKDPTFLDDVAKLFAAELEPLKSKKGLKFSLHPGTFAEGAIKETGGLGGIADAAASLVGSSATPKKTYQVPQPVIVTFQGTDGDFAIVDIADGNVKKSLGIDKMLKVPASMLTISKDREVFNANVRLYTDGKHLTQVDAQLLKNFFDPENNSIVRSFESVGGKGLACTIDSLNFGWLDNIPWETSTYGSRAPKICKVSVSLTPIHDIAPGLDSNGFNRAPVYNVGGVVRQFGGDANDEAGKGKASFDAVRTKITSNTKR